MKAKNTDNREEEEMTMTNVDAGKEEQKWRSDKNNVEQNHQRMTKKKRKDEGQGYLVVENKMNAFQVISLTLLSVLAANAQVIMPGRCPRPAVQKNFDAARYLGTWYDIQRLPHSFQKGECSTATYSLKSPGVVGVLNRELLPDGSINTISGSAWSKDPSEPAKLLVSFFENSPPAPYWVLSTDYDSYSLVYSCTDLGVLHVDFAWIMSREPTLSEQTLTELRGTLSSIGVSVDKLISTIQDEAHCSAMSQ